MSHLASLLMANFSALLCVTEDKPQQQHHKIIHDLSEL